MDFVNFIINITTIIKSFDFDFYQKKIKLMYKVVVIDFYFI